MTKAGENYVYIRVTDEAEHQNTYEFALTITSEEEKESLSDVNAASGTQASAAENAVLSDNAQEKPTEYSEMANVQKPDSSGADENKIQSDIPPKTGNTGDFSLMTAVTIAVLAAVGGAAAYNKKRKR